MEKINNNLLNDLKIFVFGFIIYFLIYWEH